jgi:uncharacterized membrane protein
MDSSNNHKKACIRCGNENPKYSHTYHIIESRDERVKLLYGDGIQTTSAKVGEMTFHICEDCVLPSKLLRFWNSYKIIILPIVCIAFWALMYVYEDTHEHGSTPFGLVILALIFLPVSFYAIIYLIGLIILVISIFFPSLRNSKEEKEKMLWKEGSERAKNLIQELAEARKKIYEYFPPHLEENYLDMQTTDSYIKSMKNHLAKLIHVQKQIPIDMVSSQSPQRRLALEKELVEINERVNDCKEEINKLETTIEE